MTSRERVIAAIEFQSPDRVPFTHVWYNAAFWRHGQALIDFLKDYPDDFGNRIDSIPPEPAQAIFEYTDEWGTRWRQRKDTSVGEVLKPAIEDWDQLRDYRLPPGPSEAEWEAMAARFKAPGRDWYALAGWLSTFEQLQFLRGTENLFLDIAEDAEGFHELLEKLFQRHLRLIEGYAKAGADGVWLSDDWGAQDRLLISPTYWRRVFKPRYRAMTEHAHNAGLHAFFHTCGWTLDILDDFVEIGVDAINAQIPLMPRDVLCQKLGGKICVFSDVDRQFIMPFGKPQDVTAHIRGLIDDFGRYNGGVMLRGELEAIWPLENIKAMYRGYGRSG